MNKTLILTGWSKTVYMTAAAAVLEALKWKADVAGVSMDALAGALKDRAPSYKTVFVLGVGLKKNIGQTISTLMELKTKGVRTVWLSSMPVAPEFAAEVCLEGVDPATRCLEEDDIRKLIKEHREINRELWSSDDPDADGKNPDNLEKTIRMYTKAVFKKYGGNFTAAREALGISVNTLKKYLAEPVKL